MHIEKLVSMANDIADFFNAESDKEIAAEGVKKTHHALMGSAYEKSNYRAFPEQW
jgi:hypothetical protein